MGPLPLGLVMESVSGGFDHITTISQSLLKSADRRALVEQAARDLPLTELIKWIDAHAAADPNGALGVFSALCGRAVEASTEDVRMLVSHRLLTQAVRVIAGSPQEASAYLVTLLRTLPEEALGPDAVTELAGYGDPVLLHALDTVVTAPAQREEIHRQVRLAYYYGHHLQAPVPLQPEAEVPQKDIQRRPRLRRPHSHRKHK